MGWSDPIVDKLAALPGWAYHGVEPLATEPAALAALALLAHGRTDAAERPLEWLTGLQATNGSVGISADQASPHWITAQAVLAWELADQQPQFAKRYQGAVDRGVRWLLLNAGKPLERTEELGHDPTLIGWSWVADTHAWIEPTSWSLLALKATGRNMHPRSREGVRMLIDRLLPDGGCNFGNTFVLGQQLLPHLQPTGVCLTALGNEKSSDPRIAEACKYLEHELSADTATSSLCYGLVGLAAQGRLPDAGDDWLAAAAQRSLKRDASAHKLSLLALAAKGKECPLIPTIAMRHLR